MFSGNLTILSRFVFVLAISLISYLSVVEIDQALPGGLSDKFYHALAFFVLSFLAALSFPESRFSYHKMIPLFLYGVLIEIVQYFLPYRSFSIGDMIADATGILVYSLIAGLLLFLRLSYQQKN